MTKKGWLFVSPWSLDSIGGVSTVITQLCREMNQEGKYQPYVLVLDSQCPTPVYNEKEDYVEIRFKLRSFSKVLSYFTISFLLHLPSTLISLYRLLYENNIKIVNPHYPSIHCIYFCVQKFLKCHIKIILSFHGTDFKNLINSQQNLRKIWSFIFYHTDKIVTCSRGLKELFNKEFYKLCNKVDYIHNGVSQDFFNKIISPIEDIYKDRLPRKYLLSVGTFECQKGQDILIDAFYTIHDKLKGLNLVLVGRTTPFLEKLKQKVEHLSLENRVLFFENIPPRGIYVFYENAEIFISPSRNESFGIAILEAAAKKVPVIATKTLGANEIITDKVDGVLVEVGNKNALAKKIYQLTYDRKLCDRYAKQLYDKTLAKFTWSKALEKYYSLALS